MLNLLRKNERKKEDQLTKDAMNNRNLTELPPLSIWIPHDTLSLSNYIHDYLCKDYEGKKILYYIDSINSFPLYDLQQITTQEESSIFDNVRLVTCLDLNELYNIILELIKTIKTNETSQDHILIMIHGMDTMCTNSSIQMGGNNSKGKSIHGILNKILVMIRVKLYNHKIKTILLSERIHFPDIFGNRNHSSNRKKPRLEMTDMEHINRYYVDEFNS